MTSSTPSAPSAVGDLCALSVAVRRPLCALCVKLKISVSPDNSDDSDDSEDSDPSDPSDDSDDSETSDNSPKTRQFLTSN